MSSPEIGPAIKKERGNWSSAPRFGAARLAWPPRPSASKMRFSWHIVAGLLCLAGLGMLAFSPVGQRWVYPLPHRGSIVKFARENGLRPTLVAALIRQESSFRVNARSAVGATGLMQLLPSTAQWVSESLEGSKFSLARLTEPEVNLRLGALYLGHLRDRFGERPILYLAAYNAGPRCVDEWLGEMNGRLAVADIPFPETRAYVAGVLRGQASYAQLYPELDAP